MYFLGRGKTRSLMLKVGLTAILSLSMLQVQTVLAAASGPNAVSEMNPSGAPSGNFSDKMLRVALFVDLGSQYKSIASAVTLSSASAFQMGMREGSLFDPWFDVSENQIVKFSLDSFMIKVLETADSSEAQSVLNRLQAMKESPNVLTVDRRGSTMYQIYLGDYSSRAEADKARERISRDGNLFSYFNNTKPVVTGNNHLSAGVYDSEQQAASVRQTILNAGMDAYIALSKNAGENLRYEVWVGQAADAADLNALKNDAARLLSGLPLVPVNDSRLYLVERSNVTASLKASGQSSTPHYFISGNTKQQKLWLNSSSSGIKVAERSNRTYRGAMELSGINNRLALVNEVSLEQYLYSVVAVEVSPSWPAESIKAQAVAARSFALSQGVKFQIANVVDTTLSQAYYGIEREHPNATAAVNATAGEVLKVNGKIIEPVYSSNSGGMTADAEEMWGSKISYLVSVKSPDEVAEQGLPNWYRIMMTDGRVGYIREDLVKDSGSKTAAGLPIYTITADGTNIRSIPLIQTDVDSVAKVNTGEKVIVLEKTIQSNTMHWVRGPFSSDELLKALEGKTKTAVKGPITSLEVTVRGPSERVTEVKVNGQVIDVKTPDSLRSALNGLPSTRFDIEQTGSYTILGANGQTRTVSGSKGTIQAVTAQENRELDSSGLLLLNGNGQAKVVTSEIAYRFVGTGNGHGVGMSQWGAKGLADQGYDYQSILKYYYKDINLVKE